MAEQVISIRKNTDYINPAAMEDTINKLLAAKYPPPDWVRQGVNWAKNTKTGEMANLNMEATEVLNSNPPRDDVIAVVEKADGAHEVVWIDQTALKAAGGDLTVVRRNLENTLKSAPIPWTLILAGGAGVAAVMYFAGRRGHRGR